MEDWVSKEGLSYRWEPQLGGFRRPQPDSKNIALRHPAFRGYADYMQTPEFWRALDRLLAEAGAKRAAIMCSESLWWRCHRRLISDAAVLARDVDVQHLFHDGRLAPHHPTEGVRRDNGFIVYDSGTQRLI